MSEFLLDHRLYHDCILIGDLDLCQLLLMDDDRWPWLILVPRINVAVEIYQLDAADQKSLARETALISEILSQISQCEKINSGALGNIVRQLHVHVIARNRGDDNWPGPVWGFGKRRPYHHQKRDQFITDIKSKIVEND